MAVLLALSFSHLMNDTIQSLIPAVYPILKQSFGLDFVKIGMITLTFQIAGALFQPAIGLYTDHHPLPYSAALGMIFTLVGVVSLAFAWSYPVILVSVALVGIGSSIFHPEATRSARYASGGRQGLAQGIFQVGGQAGAALGPLLAAFIIVPQGRGASPICRHDDPRHGALDVDCAAAIRDPRAFQRDCRPCTRMASDPPLARRRLVRSRDPDHPHGVKALLSRKLSLVLHVLSDGSFRCIDFDVSDDAVPRFHRVRHRRASRGILGDNWPLSHHLDFHPRASPFTLLLPYVGLFWTGVLTVVINLIMASAFASIMIYAMELVPERIGLIGGLFYGLNFALGGIAAAFLGGLIDSPGIESVYKICLFLPVVGLLAIFLPKINDRAVLPAKADS